MTDTPNLALPFIEGGQAQKHATHNEALRILDALVQLAVLDRTRTAPPASPVEGQRHVVAAAATGAWAGHADAIAAWQDGGWAFLVPKPGWHLWSIADGGLLVFDGTAWQFASVAAIDGIAHAGVNTTADSSNRLSVRSNAALFAAIDAADGGSGDIRLQLSKEATARTASLVFSTNFSGRAEFGLVGSDAFKLKVSPDGAAFVEAMAIDQATGNVALPRGLALTGVSAPAQITADQNDYAPAGIDAASVLKIWSDAARSLSGLASGAEGRVVSVINSGSQPITLLDDSAASAAANRFAFGGHLVLAGRQATILRYDGSAARWQAIAGAPARPPTVQTFLSGSGTYTTPPGVKWLEVLAVGGGGGSAGSGTAGGSAGTSGDDTSFGTSLIVARGGGAPPAAGFSSGGAGGIATASPPAVMVGGGTGNGGNPSNQMGAGSYPFGGAGGGSALLGGGGIGASAASGAGAGAVNTGGGAGGPSGPTGSISGASGGGAGSLRAIISTPSNAYPYGVGIGGSGGAPAAGGVAGSTGGSGMIVVTEHYQ